MKSVSIIVRELREAGSVQNEIEPDVTRVSSTFLRETADALERMTPETASERRDERFSDLIGKWADTYGEHRLSFDSWVVEQLRLSESNCDNWRRQCLDADAIQNGRNDAARRFFDRIREISQKYRLIDTALLGVTLAEFEDELFPDDFRRGKVAPPRKQEKKEESKMGKCNKKTATTKKTVKKAAGKKGGCKKGCK